jgi:hypothetical protein
VNINAALAQVAAMSQTVLKQLPAGITPPTILSFDAMGVSTGSRRKSVRREAVVNCGDYL